ncbi:MAG: IS110 family transposase [Planctomycetaceae bacterium]
MKFVGVDLHKQTITLCVVDHTRAKLDRQRLLCDDEAGLVEYFQSLGEFQAVVEATASYEWFVKLIEPLAEKVVLAHPKKLRVIAESTRKSDKLDAQVLAEFLALDMIPTSYRPTPRQRDHRRLVRQRDSIQRRITGVKNRMRRVLSDYNADRRDLFSQVGLAAMKDLTFSAADRFALDQMTAELTFQKHQLQAANRELQTFAAKAPLREREYRALLQSIPGVGFVTAEVVLAEIADIDRFDSQKQVVAYAGLAPGQRESAGRKQELHIEKTGSKHLRWMLIEAAWRLVRKAPRWRTVYESLRKRVRAKKAIVAVARRLLGMMVAILKSGQPYSPVHSESRSAAAVHRSSAAPVAATLP